MARGSQLVCQQLENISRQALEKYQDVIRHYVRRRNGIYALYRGDKLYYVGLAKSLGGRLKSHLRDHHSESWDRFSVYLPIGESHLKEMESLLLRIAKPEGNKQIGRFVKCENLNKRFAREVRGLMREELLGLIGHAIVDKDADAKDNGKRQPILRTYLDSKSMRLRARYKGTLLKAHVRKSGVIRVGRKLFNSPSLAAIECLGRPVNGWSFWHYERAPGDWVRLEEQRRY